MNEADIKLVERDICFLYHELSDYESIMEDLNYEELYSRSYWNYVDLPLAQDSQRFVQDGCLLLTLCMAWDLIEGQSNQLETSIESCRWQLDNVVPDSERTIKLVSAVKKALTCAEAGSKPSLDMNEEAQWAYDVVVAQYFRDRSQPNRPEM